MGLVSGLSLPPSFFLHLSVHPLFSAQCFLPQSEMSSDKSYRMKYLLIFLTNVDLINYQDFFMKWLLTSMAVC